MVAQHVGFSGVWRGIYSGFLGGSPSAPAWSRLRNRWWGARRRVEFDWRLGVGLCSCFNGCREGNGGWGCAVGCRAVGGSAGTARVYGVRAGVGRGGGTDDSAGGGFAADGGGSGSGV